MTKADKTCFMEQQLSTVLELAGRKGTQLHSAALCCTVLHCAGSLTQPDRSGTAASLSRKHGKIEPNPAPESTLRPNGCQDKERIDKPGNVPISGTARSTPQIPPNPPERTRNSRRSAAASGRKSDPSGHIAVKLDAKSPDDG